MNESIVEPNIYYNPFEEFNIYKMVSYFEKDLSNNYLISLCIVKACYFNASKSKRSVDVFIKIIN